MEDTDLLEDAICRQLGSVGLMASNPALVVGGQPREGSVLVSGRASDSSVHEQIKCGRREHSALRC